MTGVAWTHLFDGLDVSKELVTDHLDGLAVQVVLSTPGFPLQVVAVRPVGPFGTRRSVAADTVHPDASGFHLRGFQARSGPPVKVLESIDAHRLHGCSCSSCSVGQA